MPPATAHEPAESLLDRAIAPLYPGYFNVVMATGIVSNGFFLLGMYTVVTFRLSLAADYTPLQTVARVMIWVAFAAWLATGLGLLDSLRRARRAA